MKNNPSADEVDCIIGYVSVVVSNSGIKLLPLFLVSNAVLLICRLVGLLLFSTIFILICNTVALLFVRNTFVLYRASTEYSCGAVDRFTGLCDSSTVVYRTVFV